MRSSAPWSAILLCAALSIRAQAATPTFAVVPDTLRADSTGMWHAELRVGNLGGKFGLYPDSLSYTYRNDDPDLTDRPRTGTMALNALVQMLPPLSAGEESAIAYGGPADFERGILDFRFSAHDAAKQSYTLESHVSVTGSDLADARPAIMLESAGRHTDMIILPAAAELQPAPAILLVPPAGTAARTLMRWGSLLTTRGFAIAIVSLPGSGRSDGKADASGPASVAAVRSALARLAREPGIDPARIVIWGQREGANTALLASADHAGMQGVIAQDAEYDLWAAYRAKPETERRAFVAQAGTDSAAWRARSPMEAATRIAVPVLVLKTGDASAAAVAPAEAFIARRAARKLYIESRWSAQEHMPMRQQEVTRIVLGFAERRAAKAH